MLKTRDRCSRGPSTVVAVGNWPCGGCDPTPQQTGLSRMQRIQALWALKSSVCS